MLDNAVFVFGKNLSNTLEAVEGKKREVEKKQALILRRWLPDAPSSQRYRDPAAGLTRKPKAKAEVEGA
jgi:hypothetical protein